MCKLKQDVQDSRISRIRVLEKSTARMQDTFSRARALSSKKRAGDTPPRASRNRSRSGDPALQTFTEIRRARACPSPCLGLPQPTRGTGPRATEPARHRGGQAPALLQRAPYFACFTSPNVVNARCAGDTGPRNRRVINVSGFPPNETSSI